MKSFIISKGMGRGKAPRSLRKPQKRTRPGSNYNMVDAYRLDTTIVDIKQFYDHNNGINKATNIGSRVADYD
jgi:hypothetical protein